MKKKNNLPKIIIIILLVIVVTIFLITLCNQVFNTTPDSPETKTLSSGTQMRFENIDIGLSSVDNNSAILVFHQVGGEESVRKKVEANDIVDIYGYEIQIKSVSKSNNFSIMPGSNHGNVKFLIKKQ